MVFDNEKFLNTPMFALNQLSVFSNVADFLNFSEDNIAKQKIVALQGVEQKVADSGYEEPEVFGYRDHILTSIDFRFDVALPMRVRYAALTAFTSTVEWSVTVLKPTVPIPKEPSGMSRTIHLLFVYAQRCGISLDRQIRCLEFLIWYAIASCTMLASSKATSMSNRFARQSLRISRISSSPTGNTSAILLKSNAAL